MRNCVLDLQCGVLVKGPDQSKAFQNISFANLAPLGKKKKFESKHVIYNLYLFLYTPRSVSPMLFLTFLCKEIYQGQGWASQLFHYNICENFSDRAGNQCCESGSGIRDPVHFDSGIRNGFFWIPNL
jgi:hypothetical protein